jgi:hypothetical protein
MAYNKNFGFGAGVMFATPSDSATPTPVRFGVLQEVSVDFAFTTKQLFGSYQFPIAIGRGPAKVSGKAKFAQIDGQVLTKIMFNNTPAVNQLLVVDSEAGTVPASSSYTVTVAGSASWESDLGVLYATTGQPFKRVASAPAAGEYSVASGVYTFAAGDASAAVLISYAKTASSAGTKTTITNQVLGSAVPFRIDFYQNSPNVAGQQWGLRLNSCMSGKLTLATKLEDFTVPEFDFEAFVDSSNNLGILNLPS